MNHSLVEYVLKLAKLKRQAVKFVIIDGSTADGSDRKHSDYDITIVRKRPSKKPMRVIDIFGVFNRRLVSVWLLDEVSFEDRYVEGDDKEFLWHRRGLSKAKLLFGDRTEFDRITRSALSRRWNRKRQMAVIQYKYTTMVEYMGKMLNKIEARETDSPEFYQDGYILGANAAELVAALNEIDLDSDKTMYRQVFTMAKIKPPHFERDFKVSSGLIGDKRGAGEVVSASRRLLRWSRKAIIGSFESSRSDEEGFWQMVCSMKF